MPGDTEGARLREPLECDDAELVHYARAAIARNGNETHPKIVKWLAQGFLRTLAPAREVPAPIPQEDLPPEAAKVLRDNLWPLITEGGPEVPAAPPLDDECLLGSKHEMTIHYEDGESQCENCMMLRSEIERLRAVRPPDGAGPDA